MADTKVSALTADVTPGYDSLLVTIDDPGGTPTSRKTTIEELLTASAASANTSLFSPTGYSLTGSNATPAFNVAGTWNTTGTPTGIKFNVTDTASNADSLLMDLQVGGTSKFSVDKNGVRFSSPGGSSTQPNIAWKFLTTFNGLYSAAAGTISVTLSNGERVRFLNSGLQVRENVLFGATMGSHDIQLVRDAADTLALRRSTNAQKFNIYNTYTDASNYERMKFGWNTNIFEIKPEAAGTGSTRVVHISGLPTSNPGPGILWNNAGTPAIGT